MITKKGTQFDPEFPAPMGFYFEPLVGIADLILRTLAENEVAVLPAGDYQSICVTIFSGTNPYTGKRFTAPQY